MRRCGGDSEPDPSGGAVTITTMGFGLPDEIATTRVDAFKADNPRHSRRHRRG
jgi:multiple sugar transport system substrate-binding protein